jgi:hypothetical protein
MSGNIIFVLFNNFRFIYRYTESHLEVLHENYILLGLTPFSPVEVHRVLVMAQYSEISVNLYQTSSCHISTATTLLSHQSENLNLTFSPRLEEL